MTDKVSARPPFWRETLREFVRFMKAEWQWVLIFAAIFAIKELIPALNLDSAKISELSKAAAEQKDYTAFNAYVHDHMPNLVASVASSLLIAAVSMYAYTVLAFRMTPLGSPPILSVKGFSLWFLEMLKKYSLMFLPFMLLGALYSAAASFADENAQKTLWNTYFSLFIVWMFGAGFVFFRLLAVSPLAVLRRENVLKTSAALTKGNMYRIWYSFVIVVIIVLLVEPPLALLHEQVMRAYGAGSMPAFVLKVIIGGLISSIANAGLATYACVVCRTLLQEQNEKPVAIDTK
ncbi:MAG: hypothetical protein PHW76_09915 [Alphaproteobacteria bacterium]|nr:hypothetical protein [Alphaproteobacteria bacterium]